MSSHPQQNSAPDSSVEMTPAKAVELAGQFFTQGRYQDANRVCRQIISQTPNQADAYNILGATLNALGERKEAVAMLKKAIKITPNAASYHANLGEIERQRGNLAEARVCFLKSIEIDPNNAQAYNNLGIVYYDRKKYRDAIQSYQSAIEMNPSFAEAYNNLGNAHMALGDHVSAMQAYENALLNREFYPEAYNNLGIVLREQGKLVEAEHLFRKAISQNNFYVEAYNNLAGLCSWQGQEVEALRVLGDVLKIAPRNPTALILTARIQLNRGSHDAAERACNLVVSDNDANAEAMTVLGQIYHETDRYDDAIEVLEKALQKDPNFGEARNFYGVALKSVGRLDEARAEILKAISLNSHIFGAYANLHDLVDFSKEKDLYDRIEGFMQAAPNKQAPHMLPLHYAYANALESTGEHERALEHFIIGGRMKRAQLEYSEVESSNFMTSIANAFPAEIFTHRPFEGNPDARPVFIVGMPRSGSTLVEQILASHPDVYGAGEVKYLSRAIGVLRDRFPMFPPFPGIVERMGAGHYEIVAKSYLNDLMASAGSATRVTDKLLTNYYFVGLIHLLFPNAKIINTLRDPVDTCLSGFTKLFKDAMPHSYDLGELGRYYRMYAKLMEHWRNVLPEGVMSTIVYEDVVADTEGSARGLVEFLGLPWNDACLSFHKSDRPVKTASVAQVRKPIYKSSVERWRKYGPGLQPLIDALADIPA